MTLEINKHVGQFSRNLGNGAAALADVVTASEHVRTTGDTTIMARMIERARDKGDDAVANSTAFILRQIWDNAKMSKDNNGHTVVRIKGSKVSNTAPSILDDLVDAGVSIRGKKLRDAFKSDEEKKAAKFDPKAWAERMKKTHKDDLPAMIAALQAVAKG